MLLSPPSFSSRAEGSTNFGTRAEPCWHRRPVVSLTAVLLKRSTRVSFEFIPIKPLAATGSGGPGSYAADFHHDIPNALLPQAALTTRQRLTLLLTCSIRSRREWSAWLALCCARGSWWFLGRHEDLHLGKGEGQEAEILQQPASADLCSTRHQMVDVALLMRYIPRSCNWGENRRSAAPIRDLAHSDGHHRSTFPPVRSRPYGLWAKSCGWWTRRRRRRSRRPFGGGCYISPNFSSNAHHHGS